MAEDEGEKTEDATPKREQEAAEEGRVARSQEAGIAAAILAAAAGVKMFADDSGIVLAQFLSDSLRAAGHVSLDEGTAIMLLQQTVLRFAAAGAGLILLIAGSSLAIAVLQSGFQISPKAFKLHWERLDPNANLKRLLSPSQLVETAKAMLKVIVVGAIVWKALAAAIPSTGALSQASPAAIAPWLGHHIFRLLLTIGLAYAAVGGGDYFWQRFQLAKSLRMSKDEVKREAKEEQGDPIIRSARRRFAREVAFGQMLKDVGKASVVITNPTHIAVAIQYDDTDAPVPIVIAMGQDKVAERIKAIAAEAGVPMVENVPVARALFKSAKVGSVIPIELYMAVAEILAYVYRTRMSRGGWRGSVRA